MQYLNKSRQVDIFSLGAASGGLVTPGARGGAPPPLRTIVAE